jgi:predicted TPR repeat methyltransferase
MPGKRRKTSRDRGPARPLNPGDVGRAVEYHRAGKLEKAGRLYARILKSNPDHVDALHFAGVLQHQRGYSDQAVRNIEHAVLLAPDYADAWNNLGNVLKETARLESAVRAYRKVIELQPAHADAWNNLGVVLRGQGLYEEAARAYDRCLEAAPAHVAAWQNRGNLLARMDRLEDAAQAYLRVLELRPHDPMAYDALGKTLYRAGRVDEALDVFRRWLQAEPSSSLARHMLAACSGEAAPERAPDDYVRALFDGFAGSFDQVLDRLGYRAPALIGDLLERELPPADGSLRIVDAGCGTGLCAEYLRPRAKRLWGIDLSPGMLARARSAGGYDELVETELVAWLERHHHRFDVIVSADTLCYFGSLHAAMAAAAGALRPGGLLAFTVERADGGVEHYRLDPSGRYSHTEACVRAASDAAGLKTPGIETVVLRQEAGRDVTGLLVSARSAAEG